MNAADRRKAHLAAMAILVADGVLDRRDAIEALMNSEDRQQARASRGKAAPGEETARSLARLIDQGDMTYADAEHNVALVLTGGSYDRYDAAAKHGNKLLSFALTRRDSQRHDTAQELQQAISGPLATSPEARGTPAAAGLVSTPSQRPRPVIRQPGRGA